MGNQQTTEHRERLGRNKMVMDRLRRSLRESFRRRKDPHVPECSKPHQWQADESAVRAGTCNFQIKYLGCVEVFESRGMQVCEEALKVLRNSRRRPVKGTLYVTGDGLRVVDDETKGLIVDQTIEKVSFCAPDRNHDKGFSYICRDGTTRRWMCHGFLAIRDSGERLSHAVGCAFAVCLEKKQKRDKETVMMNFDPKTSSFTRMGSFRQTSLTERMQDPQDCKIADPPPVKQVHNPHAIERPHATVNMLQRQGSFRGFGALNQTSPFKRQLSLRVNDLPSNVERQRAMSLESGELLGRPNGPSVDPIPESSPVIEKTDTISAMCQQVSQGLSLLTSDENIFRSQTNHAPQLNETGNPWEGRNMSFSQDVGADLPKSSSNPTDLFGELAAPTNPVPPQPVVPPRRSSPNFSHLRSHSLGSAEAFLTHPATGKASFEWSAAHHPITNGTGCYPNSAPYSSKDPFDAEWAAVAVQNKTSTNPFAQSSVKTFEVHM